MLSKVTITLLLFLLCLPLCLAGCGGDPPTPTPEPEPEVPTYLDPTHQSGTYKVTYKLWIDEIVHYYEAGEIPDPPTATDIDASILTMVFREWDRPFVPVNADCVYTACYDRVSKLYDAIFILGDGSTITVPTRYGREPLPPTDVPDYRGMAFASWDRPMEAAMETTYYTAIYASTLSKDLMQSAYNMPNWTYALHGFRDMQQVASMYALLYEVRNGYEQPLVARRIAEQIECYARSTGPKFDLDCLWDYGITTAFFAAAKDTPAVWDLLSFSTVKRIDTLMSCFAYIEAVGTSDLNDYQTGPGKTNNYRKTWNPNYRLANVPCMVFTTYYFGNGDMEAGAEYVNALLHGFNEATYQSLLATFEVFGYVNALTCWGTEDARKMLVSGVAPGGRGSGVGVSNAGQDYTYEGVPLERGGEILRRVIAFNYSGGAVKNDHWYTVNGKYQRVAWIVDGTETPYLGMNGMMLEFNSGSRSSTAYCDHDFVMGTIFLSIARELTLYRTEGESRVPITEGGGHAVLYDCTEDTELWPLIQVGNEDFLYKMIHGYVSFYIYASGPSQGAHGEKDASTGYYMMKHLWRRTLLPLGTLFPAQ